MCSSPLVIVINSPSLLPHLKLDIIIIQDLFHGVVERMKGDCIWNVCCLEVSLGTTEGH